VNTTDQAFDSEAFRAQGYRVVDALADYLAQARGGSLPVLPWTAPAEQATRFPADFPAEPAGGFDALLREVLAHSTSLHHPHFVGHQVSAPLPLAALCDLTAALLNNGMAVYEMGPAATAMENAVTSWLCGQLGWGTAAGGILTSGGSAGNLTALLAARQAQAGFDVWTAGAQGGPPLCALVSGEAHYSIKRAVQIMGWGKDGAWLVPLDARLRMRADAMPEAFARAEAAGRKPVAVVANACSTATGSYDPLAEVAAFCRERKLWLHVDGAHGAVAALAPKYRHLLKGIEAADSVVWDAHKLMQMPALATAVLYKDGRHAYGAFAQHASYLFTEQQPEAEAHNLGTRTLECTKRMIAFKLYAGLAVLGTRFFADHVTRSFDLARVFAEHIKAAPDFELALEPEANIVCFRHTPRVTLADGRDTGAPSPEALDQLQVKLRTKVNEGGRYYLVQTRLPQGLFLRTTLMNPFTTEAALVALLEVLRVASRT